jgi:hypothetical protein
MRRGVNFDIADLDHLNLRMRYEFDIEDNADADTPGNDHSHRLSVADFHDRRNGYLRILQGEFKCASNRASAL